LEFHRKNLFGDRTSKAQKHFFEIYRYTMTEKQTADPATQQQPIKYPENTKMLYRKLQKERELFSKSKKKELELYVENITKKHIFYIHLMVTIITSYLTIFGPTKDNMVIWAYIFTAFYLSTNLFMLYIPSKYFLNRTIFYYLIFFHSFMICLGMFLSGNARTDFYLIYFLILGLSSMSISLKYLMLNTTIFVFIYGWILFQKGLLEPQLILADYIHIFHPELLPEHENVYYELLK